MTDDSGRESREPVRAAENAVDAVLREVGYEAGLGAVPLMVEQATVRIVERALQVAYAQGALDMRTRAAAVALECDRTREAACAAIEALDAEVSQ